MAESRSERKARLQSVPWIHIGEFGLDYDSPITAPFSNAIPFLYNNYEISKGEIGATVLNKKNFPTMKKPGLFAKKHLDFAQLSWVKVGSDLSMRIDEPFTVDVFNKEKREYIYLPDFSTSVVIFVKSWNGNKLFNYLYRNNMHEKDYTLYDLAEIIKKTFKKAMEDALITGVIPSYYCKITGKAVSLGKFPSEYVVPSIKNLNATKDKTSKIYKESMRAKVYLVSAVNKVLEDMGAQNDGYDMVNIGDHLD